MLLCRMILCLSPSCLFDMLLLVASQSELTELNHFQFYFCEALNGKVQTEGQGARSPFSCLFSDSLYLFRARSLSVLFFHTLSSIQKITGMKLLVSSVPSFLQYHIVYNIMSSIMLSVLPTVPLPLPESSTKLM